MSRDSKFGLNVTGKNGGPISEIFNYCGMNMGAPAQGKLSEDLNICSGRRTGTSENMSGCSEGQTGVPNTRQVTTLHKSTSKREKEVQTSEDLDDRWKAL